MRHHSQETAPSLYVQAAKDAFRKLDPRVLVRNPVMFVVAVGCVFTTASFFSRVVTGADAGFSGQISLWLWFTVLFANFAEALAEGRGKAQADTLRSARTDTVAHRLLSDGTVETVSASELAPGDRVVVEAGDMIPADGTVVEGVAAVDESAITGESAPVIRESGGDRSAVTGGTTVLSDRIVVNVTQEPGKSFLDRMIALVEGAERQKTPNEIALNILLAGLTLIFMLVVVTLKPLGLYHGINIDMVVLVALLVLILGSLTLGVAFDDAAGVPHPDHDQRPARGHRHRRDGPPAPAQCAGPVGPRGGGRRGRGCAAARQDRDDHARQPHGLGVPASARREYR